MADKYKHIGFTEGGKRVFKQDKKFYLKKKNKYVSLPKNTKVISIDNYKSSQEGRGKEVSVSGSSEYAQFIYGRMRVGGTYIFLDTSQNTYSYLVSGSTTHSLLWTAKTAGILGNNITVRLISSGTVGAISISVVGNAIEVTLRSSGGAPLTTRNELITAIEANVPASLLVSIARVGEAGNGVVQPMSTTNLSYGGGNTLHQFLSITCHEIDSIEKLYIDDREVTFGASPDPRWATGIFANRVFMSQVLGSDTEEAQPDLRNQLPSKWSTDHTHKGMSGAYVILEYDQNTFAEGFPELEFLVKGKKCYDPRTATTVWTQNAALIIADYLTNTKYGLGIPYSKIDETTLIDSANNCDENVTLALGGTEKRYTINGRFDCGMTHRQVLEEMILAMAGSLVFQGGKYYILSGKWRASVATINEDDFRGALRISLNVSKRDNYNGVKGTYINPSSKYDDAEFTLVKNSTYITQDGAENFLDINFNLVQSSPTAQRIAKVMLERNRQSIEIAAQMSARLLNLVVGDTVTISFSKYGWVSKAFEVKDFNPSVDPESGVGCEITFRETASGIYTDSMAEVTYDLGVNTTLPNAYTVISPTDLVLTSGTSELYLRQDGTIFSRLKASWTATSDLFVVSGGSYQVEYKKSSDVNWSGAIIVPASQNSVHILDVQDGANYDVRVKALNSIGVSSSYLTSTNHTVIGKTEKPSAVQGFSGFINNFGISLSWLRNSELDIKGYRIKRSTSNNWNTETVVQDIIYSNSYEDNFRTVGTWYYLIKAIDTSGNESENTSSFVITVNAPSEVPNLNTLSTNNIILIDWAEPNQTSFPVAKYRVRKGATFETSTLLGEVFVTFLTYTENFAGESTFWVSAVDTGNNEALPIGKNTRWYSPPNVTNYSYDAIDVNDSDFSSAAIDDQFANSFIAPIISPDSFIQHFTRNGWLDIDDQVAASPIPFIGADIGWIDEYTDRGWTTIQDKINAGFTIWILPADTDIAYFSRVLDTNLIIQSARVDITFSENIIIGSCTVQTLIETSLDLISWTAYPIGTQSIVNNFRFVRVTISIDGADEFSLVRIGDPVINVGVKTISRTGRATTDVTGSVFVDIGSDFLSLDSIQLTAIGGSTNLVYPVFDYQTLNPTSFQALGYVSGNLNSVEFSWTVEGKVGEI